MLDIITDLLGIYVLLVINAFFTLLSSAGDGPEMFKATYLLMFSLMPAILLFQGVSYVWRYFTKKKIESEEQ